MNAGEALKVLVVCTANQCRSPLVAALLRRKGAETGVAVAVASAGTDARQGSRASEGSVVEAQRLGLDLTTHRSVGLDPEVMLEADLVVTMEAGHVERLAGRFPGCLAETFTLIELAEMAVAVPPLAGEGAMAWLDRASGDRSLRTLRRTGIDIDDPIGGRQADYHRMAEQVEGLTAIVVDALRIATQSDT